MRYLLKRKVAMFLAIMVVLSLVIHVETQNVSAATATPTFGEYQGKIKLYVNDPTNDSRVIKIPIKNFEGKDKGYSYKAYSEKKSIATTKQGTVNSKTGISLKIQAIHTGDTRVILQIAKNEKVIQKIAIKVEVEARPMPKPVSLKFISRTTNSVKISYTLKNTSYATGVYIELSQSANFNSIAKSYKTTSVNLTTVDLTGLQKGTYYYCRVATLSTRNGCNLRSDWSSIIGVYTSLR